jgi:hypothetical protein
MSFDADVAKTSIESAVKEFLKEEKNRAHLRRGRVERTCATDLATKLKALFESDIISVDSPYNRHHNATKYLSNKVIELDIAIHERGNDENNLIAVELETNNKPKCDDVWKLEGLTQPLGGYGYKLGLFLVFGIEDKSGELLAMDWFVDGKKV